MAYTDPVELPNRSLSSLAIQETFDIFVVSKFQVGVHLGVSKNRGIPKSSILIGFSLISHPFWDTPFLETPICING